MTISASSGKRKVSVSLSMSWDHLDKLDKLAHHKRTSRSAIVEKLIEKEDLP